MSTEEKIELIWVCVRHNQMTYVQFYEQLISIIKKEKMESYLQGLNTQTKDAR